MMTGWASISALKVAGSSRGVDRCSGAGERVGDAGQQGLGFRGGGIPGGRAADADAWRAAGLGVRIAQVSAGDGAGEQRAVGDGASHDADRVEAVGHDLHADAADHAVGRLVADDAAVGRRADDAAGGLGAVGEREQAGADARRPNPEDDPPGVWAGLAGFMVGPGLRVANSVVTVLPMTTAPAARAQATGAELALGCQPAQIGEPYWLGMSAVSSTSFTPIGMPCSGPGLASAAAARGPGRGRNGRRLEPWDRVAMWSR